MFVSVCLVGDREISLVLLQGGTVGIVNHPSRILAFSSMIPLEVLCDVTSVE